MSRYDIMGQAKWPKLIMFLIWLMAKDCDPLNLISACSGAVSMVLTMYGTALSAVSAFNYGIGGMFMTIILLVACVCGVKCHGNG